MEAQIRKQIINAFKVFDREDEKVDIREIGTIIRSLGCHPNEEELRDIIAEIEDENMMGEIHLSKFIPVATKIITDGRFKAASEEKLLNAFLLLDTEKKGHLESEKLKEILIGDGEPFNQEEMDEMANAFVDSNGLFDYKKYVKIIMEETD